MTNYDIIIIGGGIAGSSLGALLSAGARVAILEAEEHCAFHSTGRSAAFWLASYGGPGIIPLTLSSKPFFDRRWPGVEVPLLRPRGAIFIAREDADLAEVESGDPQHQLDRELLDRQALERAIPGLKPGWNQGLAEPSCADIEVAALHNACLTQFRRHGGTVFLSSALRSARRVGGEWRIQAGEQTFTAPVIVNAAGAWADVVAERCEVPPIGIAPKRRTMVQLRVGQTGLRDLPQVIDALGRFYFKGEGDRSVWLSPHDEIETDPCDAAPEEIDVATAIDRFESAVDWKVEHVERKWAGLRSFAPDRLPVYGFDPAAEGFFWCAGQGGFGIQTAPAAAHLAAGLIAGVDCAVPGIAAVQFSPARFRTA
ncbi:MAG: NAD(P)/FAD-dependent oxidoreductase [Sphingomicrobium sp.]